jgi:transposase
MNTELKLPDNPEALRDFARDLVKQLQCLKFENATLLGEKVTLPHEKSLLQEQINLLLHKRFSANSEKYRAEQADLFNEAEAYAEESGEVESIEAESTEAGETVEEALLEPATRESMPPRKPGRKALPQELPRVEILHDLPEEQRCCAEGHALIEIGEEISEQLDIIPAKVQVLRHIRKKYACPCCQANVKTAPLPAQPIPKSNASPGLLAYVATSKFVDALPLNRQSKLFARIGTDINRATLASWMIRCGQLIQPLINLLEEPLLHYPVLQMDETTVQVLKEPGRAAESPSYLWVRRGGPPDQPVVLFHYAPSRSQQVANQLLQGYQGTVQTDGYTAYAAVCAKNGLRHAGCFAHARRKFDEALKATGKGKPKAGKASKALGMIQKLYRIEAQIKHLSPEDKIRIRQEQAVPLLQEIKAWADTSLIQVPPSSLIGKALGYLGKHWASLIVYCEDGRVDIDNNAVERAIRPFVIGRNNWLFSDTVHGAKASANLYSLIETAKLNGLEPYRYLWHIFKELPKAQALDDIEQLLPWAVDQAYINALK